MSVGLGTELRSMAAEVEASPEVDGGDLWTRGRARARRRRVLGATAFAAMVAVAALTGMLVPAPSVVMPAGSPHAPAVPKNVYTPSRWLAGTDRAGPIGPLAVLGGAPRRGANGVFGISASTGEYRFLDLPDLAEAMDVKLSPDGRHVAYWLTGRTPQKPFHLDGEPVVVGVAVYDTVTGKVVRLDPGSPHGLASGSFVWLDDRTLEMDYGPRDTPHSSSDYRDWVWRIDARTAVRAPQHADFALFENPDGSYLQRRGVARFVQVRRTADGMPVDPGTILRLPRIQSVRYADGDTSYSPVSRSGDLVAVVLDGAVAVSNPLMVGRIGRDGRVPRLDAVDGLQNVELVGWRDDHTVLVFGNLDHKAAAPIEVDLRTRHARQIGVAGPLEYYPRIQLATELVDQPMVAGLHPPQARDPRLRTITIAAALGLGGAAVWLVVRRRRRRA